MNNWPRPILSMYAVLFTLVQQHCTLMYYRTYIIMLWRLVPRDGISIMLPTSSVCSSIRHPFWDLWCLVGWCTGGE